MEKRIGFLSFGHWQPIPGSQVRTGRDALVQSVELAVAAEELGLDGAYVRVHHFARQLASPFPLLTAMAMRTQPDRAGHRRHRHALREPAVHGRGGRGRRPAERRPAAARRQPGVTGDGAARLGGLRLRPGRGRATPTSPGRRPALFLAAISGATVVDADPRMTGGASGRLAVQPQSPGPAPTGSGGGRAPAARRCGRRSRG